MYVCYCIFSLTVSYKLLQEIMTETIPYYNQYQSPVVVQIVICKKMLPEKPVEMSEELRSLWDICNKCWNHKPKCRAAIKDVISDLNKIQSAIPERAELKSARRS